jgi:hypothetical protein
MAEWRFAPRMASRTTSRRGAPQHQRAGAAVRQPVAGHRPPGGFDDPYRHLGGDPHPILTNRDTQYVAFGAFGATDPDINSPRIQSWNVTLERQLGTVWGVAASYLGSYSDRLWNQLQLNPAVFLGTGPCVLGGVAYPVCSTTANVDARRVLTLSGENPDAARLIGNLDLHVDIGTQTYRGLKLSFRRRSDAGISLNGNYTISRCFGDVTVGGFPQLAQGYTNPADPRWIAGTAIRIARTCPTSLSATRRRDSRRLRCGSPPRTGACPAS